jgi:hypothetical protein
MVVLQGLVQGMITGIRGLCNGLGPAMFGLIFYLFHVDLNEKVAAVLYTFYKRLLTLLKLIFYGCTVYIY